MRAGAKVPSNSNACREKDADHLGTVRETMPRLKVQWDSGQISYFRRDRPANVKTIAGLL